MKKKKKITLMIIGILLVALIAVGTSYAYWRLSIRQQSTNRYASSCFNVSVDLDKDEPITLNNARPLSDEEGLALEPYTFTIENTCDAVVNYSIQLNVLEDSTLDSKYVKYSTTSNDTNIVGLQNKVDAKINNATAYEIKTGILAKGQKQEINLRLWLDQYTPQSVGQSKTFNTKIVVDSIAKKSQEYADASGAERPELDNGLIPVVYNSETDNWVKADTTQKWYDYDEQWWANAVTVTASSRSNYATAEVDTPIAMDNIETMWVWIPRYEYQHTNLSTKYAGGTKELPGAITINFISKDKVEASDPSNFTIHDAFWWDNNNNGIKDTGEQLSGIWVAKFEMSPTDTACKALAINNCNKLQTPIIKPNVTSWRWASIGTFWTSIHQYMNGADNQYGLINSDAHLMKNMEWGAVTYLSQSKYGKYGNENYTGANKEIYQNKSSDYITGMSNGTPGSSTTNAQVAYNVEEAGTGASTTGNIYGIYDMSGGAEEYVMGIMKESTNTEPAVGYNNSTDNSGWSGKLTDGTLYIGTYGRLGDDPSTADTIEGIGSRYYDLYEYGTSFTDYTRYHKGDATYETRYWGYKGGYAMVYSNEPFFKRGGWYANTDSIFSSQSDYGHAYANTGRPVLVAQPE